MYFLNFHFGKYYASIFCYHFVSARKSFWLDLCIDFHFSR